MWQAASPFRSIPGTAILWLALAAPPVRAWLEASMALHMLLQLPLLAATGYAIGRL